jgi:hypothetical protein
MLAQVFHPYGIEKNYHAAQPRESRCTDTNGVAERLALISEQDDQEERQDGREGD